MVLTPTHLARCRSGKISAPKLLQWDQDDDFLEQQTDLKVDVNNDAKIRDIAIILVSYKFRALFSWLLPPTDPLEMMLKTKKFQWNFEAWGSWDPVWTPS